MMAESYTKITSNGFFTEFTQNTSLNYLKNQTSNSDELIQEIWVINNSICIGHITLVGTNFDLDPQLMSGFITALIAFSNSSNDNLKNIDFDKSRLTFLQTKNFILVVRSSTDKPIDRVIQITKNLEQELNFVFETDDYWKKELNDVIRTNKIQLNMNKLLIGMYHELSEKNKVILQIDFHYFVNMISQIYFKHKIFLKSIKKLDRSLKFINSEFFDIIQNSSFDLDVFEGFTYKTIFYNILEFYNCIIESLKANLWKIKNRDKQELHKCFIKYLESNWRFVNHFGVVKEIIDPLLNLINKTNV
jgi:hypothetical protein